MKTIAKHIAAVTFSALILLAGTASADGTEAKASGHEIVETSLQLESWMTNENYWSTATSEAANYQLETENTMELESWMTTENAWEVNNKFAPETETALHLEDWMTDTAVWKQYETEETLAVEDWMTNPKVW
jgi:hypothetical protein